MNSTKGFRNIQGITEMSLSQGETVFSNFRISALPNTEMFFKVETSEISRFYSEYFVSTGNLSDYEYSKNYKYIFSMKFRQCEIGEIYISQINMFEFFCIL